jgi:hypothetical protein
MVEVIDPSNAPVDYTILQPRRRNSSGPLLREWNFFVYLYKGALLTDHNFYLEISLDLRNKICQLIFLTERQATGSLSTVKASRVQNLHNYLSFSMNMKLNLQFKKST